MQNYVVNGAVELDGVRYVNGSTIALDAGTVRDNLLSAGAIYRADLPPYRPREAGPTVLLPVSLEFHAWPAPYEATLGFQEPRLLDEWAIPSGQWPWTGAWATFSSALFKPARGLRPIP